MMKMFLLIVCLICIIGVGYVLHASKKSKPKQNVSATYERATFAGGCFWCLQPPYDTRPGVQKTLVGYAGGSEETATYEQVSQGTTDHKEAVQITYDPSIISYDQLLEIFWKQIDPTDPGGQFTDRGPHYQTAIFYHTEQQREAAEKSSQFLAESGRYEQPIVTDITPYTTFFPAEEYHQTYYKKAPFRYAQYKQGSGRGQRIEQQEDLELPKEQPPQASGFVKPSKEQLKKTLTRMQYRVTQQDRTEPPFFNAYRNNKREGIYIDIVSGEPLFSSADQYDSGTGRPSFTKPIHEQAVRVDETKNIFGGKETRSSLADSHLGHVFDDGPNEHGGLRYCMNSASMAFVPLEDMERSGYEQRMSTVLPQEKE